MNFVKIILIIFSFSAFANNKKPDFLFDNLTLSLGNWSPYVGSIQKDNELNSLFDFELRPYFAIGLEYPFIDKWSLIPEVGYVYDEPANTNYLSKHLFIVRADAVYAISKRLRIRVGSSLMIVTYSGVGGEKTIEGPTSNNTFFVPSDRKTALNQTLDLGVEYIYDRVSLRLSTYIYAFLEEQNRSLSASFTFNYLIPFKEL